MLSRALQSCSLVALFLSSTSYGAITVFEKAGWNLQINGFAELDMIVDSNRSVSDVAGNAPVDLPTTANGSHSRTQFSVRNSRFGITAQAPEFCGFATKAVLEVDFFGFNPVPGTGTTEASFFNNPSLRMRHAYFSATRGAFQLAVGQTWELFAWQPYYFMSTQQVQPLAAMSFGRTAQVRALYSLGFGDNFASLHMGLAVLRPVQRDGLAPDFQAGLRLALNQYTSPFTGSSSNPVKQFPASLAISGLVRNIAAPGATPTDPLLHNVGGALAANAFVPLFNSLSVVSEFTYGSGFGEQFPGFTGNLPSPLTAFNLDAGLGGYDAAGNFALINLYTFNVHAQYHLPQWLHTYFNAGFGQLYSNNMATIVTSKPSYNRSMVVFANVVHDFSEQIRAGFEYAYMQTGYTDGSTGANNRYQVTTHFIF